MHVCARACVCVWGQVSVCVISPLVMACDSAAANVLAGERLRAQKHKCPGFLYHSRIRNTNYLFEQYIKVAIKGIAGRRKDYKGTEI